MIRHRPAPLVARHPAGHAQATDKALTGARRRTVPPVPNPAVTSRELPDIAGLWVPKTYATRRYS